MGEHGGPTVAAIENVEAQTGGAKAGDAWHFGEYTGVHSLGKQAAAEGFF